MQITHVKIYPVAPKDTNRTKALASVTFDNEFVVHEIKVIDGNSGLFIAMPSKKTLNGEFRDTAHPINTETRKRISDAVLEAYKEIEGE